MNHMLVVNEGGKLPKPAFIQRTARSLVFPQLHVKRLTYNARKILAF